MSRAFGMIYTSIWESEKFRRLSNDTARLAYLYLLTCRHGNSVGTFRVPSMYLAADLGKSESEAHSALKSIEVVELIDYDEKQQVVRVHSWLRHNPITNFKHFQGAMKSVIALPTQSPLRAKIAVDLIAAGLEKARELRATGREKMRAGTPTQRSFGERNMASAMSIVEASISLRATICERDEPGFYIALKSLTDRERIALSEALSIEVNEPLPIHKRQRQETETRDRDTQEAIAQLREKAAREGRY